MPPVESKHSHSVVGGICLLLLVGSTADGIEYSQLHVGRRLRSCRRRGYANWYYLQPSASPRCLAAVPGPNLAGPEPFTNLTSPAKFTSALTTRPVGCRLRFGVMCLFWGPCLFGAPSACVARVAWDREGCGHGPVGARFVFFRVSEARSGRGPTHRARAGPRPQRKGTGPHRAQARNLHGPKQNWPNKRRGVCSPVPASRNCWLSVTKVALSDCLCDVW